MVHRRDLVGCIDCFSASLSTHFSAPLVGFGAQRFAPTAQVRLRSVCSGAPHRSNTSLQRTAWQHLESASPETLGRCAPPLSSTVRPVRCGVPLSDLRERP